jgi:periplasmic protein TonB
VLHLDPRVPATPRLPHRRLGPLTQLAASVALHTTLAAIAAAITSAPGINAGRAGPITDQRRADAGPLVFLAPELQPTGRGGGGGGHRQPEPIRRAQGAGTDAATLRVQKVPPAVPVATTPRPAVKDVSSLPSIVIDAKPLASGLFEQVGLPAGGVTSGTSKGPGGGGGVGTGSGTGIGSGRGPGLGRGSGGGTGGGVYRAGGAVSAPRLILEVKPKYTSQALLNKIQGRVVLEAIVTGDGCASQIRVVRSLDAGGLDDEAVAAVAQWRFEPGLLGAVPVNVLVTIELDFSVR